jgi:hypothetical protein
MNDTSHFQIQGSFDDSSSNANNKIDLNYRNIPEKDIIDSLKNPFCEAIQHTADISKLNEIKVFRKTIMQEVEQVTKDGGFANNQSEKWLSESLSKVLGFQNKGIPIDLQQNQRILELKMDKTKYLQFRQNDVIPQFQSKGSGKSVYNFEGIEGGARPSQASTVSSSVERNIGINKDHIEQFNENIKSINVLDPSDPFVKNKFLRYLSENKIKSGMTAFSVIYEIHTITLILMDKNGEAVSKLTVRISEIIINKVGSYITSAIASLLPIGITPFAIGVLGSIIFAFIGKKIGEFIFTLFPKVAPGEGAPISDYLSFIYGSNSCFGEPLSEYNLDRVLGIPKSDYKINVDNVARKPPTNNYEDKFMQKAFGRPK